MTDNNPALPAAHTKGRCHDAVTRALRLWSAGRKRQFAQGFDDESVLQGVQYSLKMRGINIRWHWVKSSRVAASASGWDPAWGDRGEGPARCL